MSKVFKSAILALGLVGATLSTAGTASAEDIGVSINLGNVAFAYRDGYWDQDRHWHPWRNKHEARDYRARQHNEYHDWNHDRDHDRGWHGRK